MSKLIRFFLCIIMISLCFCSVSHAIDEAELYNTTNTTLTSTNDNTLQSGMTTDATFSSSQNTVSTSTYNNLADDSVTSTTVSSVSSVSDASPVSNILSIALIVVGLLLILLAIAILIRLKN